MLIKTSTQMNTKKNIKAFLNALANIKRKDVLVAGPFRSGTNLLKYYLNANSNSNVLFSKWFWKHGLPPTVEGVAVPEGVPIAIMARDPVELNISLYKFWKKRRPELDAGESISEFIRKPLILYDNTGGNVRPKYRFSSPTDYWNSFYYAWINWPQIDARRVFVKIEELHEAPNKVVTDFIRFAELTKLTESIIQPNFYLSPSQDGRKVEAAAESLKKGSEENIILNESDRALIAKEVDRDVARKLGYDYG